MNLTQQAHDLICENFGIDPMVKSDSCSKKITNAIDATCGNGNDSLFLAEHSKHLLCFDVQAKAIKRTRELLALETVDCSIEYLHMGHENILKQATQRQINSQIDVAMFNLGFLPKSDDQHITTAQTSTVEALQQSMQCLSGNGVISILCYRGHDGGPEEFEAVKTLIDQANDCWQFQQFDSAKATDTTPVLLFLKKAS